MSDGTLWVAPSLGMPVRVDEDIAQTSGTKMHLTTAWDYANIHAPEVK